MNWRDIWGSWRPRHGRSPGHGHRPRRPRRRRGGRAPRRRDPRTPPQDTARHIAPPAAPRATSRTRSTSSWTVTPHTATARSAPEAPPPGRVAPRAPPPHSRPGGIPRRDHAGTHRATARSSCKDPESPYPRAIRPPLNTPPRERWARMQGLLTRKSTRGRKGKNLATARNGPRESCAPGRSLQSRSNRRRHHGAPVTALKLCFISAEVLLHFRGLTLDHRYMSDAT